MEDPDIKDIHNIGNTMVGSEIKLVYEIKLPSGVIINNPIDNCNITGNCIESIFIPMLKKEINTIEVNIQQKSPDFWNRNKEYEYEIKCFKGSPSFDISAFICYINQLYEKNGVLRKLYRTKYLIFEYKIQKSVVKIVNFWLLDIWNLIGFNGKYPITLQCKKNTWWNIRPCAIKDWKNMSKDRNLFFQQIIKAIENCPNNIDNRNDIIKNITLQFNKLSLK